MRTGGFAPSGGDIISDRRYYYDDCFRFAAVGVSLTAGQNDSGKVWLNDRTGLFTDSEQTLTPGYILIHGMTIGDINTDRTHDAIMTGAQNQVWLNDGAGNFSDSEQRLARLACDPPVLGDFDADGDLDASAAHGELGQDTGGGIPNEVSAGLS